MNTDSLNQMIARIAPLMLLLSLVMVVCGAALMLYFGYGIYQLLMTPEQSVFLKYVLSQIPTPIEQIYQIRGTMDGKDFVVEIPTGIFAYGRYVLAFLIYAMVGGLVTNLIGGGMNIFKVLTRLSNNKNASQKDISNADTRNSNYSR